MYVISNITNNKCPSLLGLPQQIRAPWMDLKTLVAAWLISGYHGPIEGLARPNLAFC